MKKTLVMVGAVLVLFIAAVLVVNRQTSNPPPPPDKHTAAHTHNDRPATAAKPAAKVLPAFYEEAPSRSSLGPTLAPEQFTGLVRDAYRAARAIPVTMAQIPCYCFCDRGMGHKSLYSCFEDDHASHCAVCVDEALLAFKLEKEGKLTAPQIRERIVERFKHLAN